MNIFKFFKKEDSPEVKMRKEIIKRWDQSKIEEHIYEEMAYLNNQSTKLIQEYKDTVKRIKNKIQEENLKARLKSDEIYLKDNGECPKCKSHDIIDKINQVKGSLNGSSVYGFGSISGSIDTVEVNVCKNCGNEWKRIPKHDFSTSIYSELIYIRCILNNYIKIADCKFDPLDLSEEYDSLEEKKENLTRIAENAEYLKFTKEFWQGTKIEIFKMIIDECRKSQDCLESHYAKCIKETFDREDNLAEKVLIEKLGFIK